MNVYLLDLSKLSSFDNYKQYIKYVSMQKQKKIECSHLESTKLRLLCSELLIKYICSIELNVSFYDISILYSPYGKPYITTPNYHFSVSSTDNLIVFISSTIPVGIDIEKKRQENFQNIAKRFFCPAEYEYVYSTPQNQEKFFKIWTAKEAYAKMIGFGLSMPFKSFNVLSPNLESLFISKLLEEYFISICSMLPTKNQLMLSSNPKIRSDSITIYEAK